MEKQFSHFPMFVNLEGKNVVIFGAGNIAIRRVLSLLNTGCNITVVAPQILCQFYNIQNINIIKDKYDKKYLKNAFMVLAITNDAKINDTIYNHCKQQNIIINVASDKQKCDFFFPGVVYKDGYTVGICGNGKNHKLIKNITDKIKNFLQ